MGMKTRQGSEQQGNVSEEKEWVKKRERDGVERTSKEQML